MPIALSSIVGALSVASWYISYFFTLLADLLVALGDPRISWEFAAIVLLLFFRNNRGICVAVISISIILWLERGESGVPIGLEWFGELIRRVNPDGWVVANFG